MASVFLWQAWRNFAASAFLFLASLNSDCWRVAAAPDTNSPITDQEVQYIWPTVLWNVPLKGIKDSPTKGKKSGTLTDEEIVRKLATTAEKGFNHYVKEILPRELEIDTKFAAEYAEADGSRVQVGFHRWQTRAYHQHSRLPIEELDWDGKPVPKLQGISYDWKEFFDSEEMSQLTYKVKQTSAAYLNSMGGREKRKFRVFPWVEVYGPRDYLKPHMHTGASCSATFFAKTQEPGANILIEDVRGLNAPFGRTHEIEPKQGELLITPAWASHMVMPNKGNGTSVYINFLMWPPGGAPDLDWEDDLTGDYIYKKRTKIKAASKAKAPPKQEL